MTGHTLTNPPAPGSPEWLTQITASKIPPMMTDPTTGEYMGLGYQSARSLYDSMTGATGPEIHDEATLDMFARGHAMEAYAAARWLDEHPGYTLSEPHPNGKGGYTAEVAYIDTDIPGCNVPIVATCDNIATHNDGHQVVLECKSPMHNNGMEQGWRVQHNVQMGVSGIHTGYILIYPEYGKPEIIRHDFEPGLWALTIKCVNAFTARLQWGAPPPETDPERARLALAAEHADYDTDGVIDLHPDEHGDIVDAWTAAHQALTVAQAAYDEASNDLAEALGDYKAAKWDGRTVVSRTAPKFAKSRYPDQDKLKDANYQKPTTTLDTDKLKEDDPDGYAQALGSPGYRFSPQSVK